MKKKCHGNGLNTPFFFILNEHTEHSIFIYSSNGCIFKGFRVTVFNATFNNISVISRRSILLAEKPESPEKTTDLLASH